jgi:hypothetical protein
MFSLGPLEYGGRTTRTMAKGLNIAARGTVTKFPAWWRYVWAHIVAILSLGYFDIDAYLEKHAKRKSWNVVYIIHRHSMIDVVQRMVSEMLHRKKSTAAFDPTGTFLDFREISPSGGTFKFVALDEVERYLVGRRDVYLICDHHILDEQMPIPEDVKRVIYLSRDISANTEL